MPPQPPQPSQPSPSQPEPSPSQPEPAATTTPPAAAGSSPASERDSGASPLVGDPGPAFEADHAEPNPEQLPPEPDALAEPEPGWEEATVRQLLLVKGQLLHGLIGYGPIEWEYTAADLAAIGGPLTRILNRYEPARELAKMGDPIALGLGFGMYTTRSLRERQVAIREAEEAAAAEEEEVSAPAAPATPATPHNVPGIPPGTSPAPPPASPPPAPAPAPAQAGEFDPKAVQWTLG